MKKICWRAFRLAGALVMVGILFRIFGALPEGRAAGPLASGQADATLKVSGKSYKLAYAAALVDQKDKDKPVILLITDVQLPVSGWTSEFDFMGYKAEHKVNGVLFWLDDKRQVFSSKYLSDGVSTSASNIYELKLEGSSGKSFVGSMHSKAGLDPKMFPISLEGTFSAALK